MLYATKNRWRDQVRLFHGFLLSSFLSSFLASSFASASPVETVHRRWGLQGQNPAVNSLAYCDPQNSLNTNFFAPKSIHAACMDRGAGGTPIRFYRYDLNGDLIGQTPDFAGPNPSQLAIENSYHANRKLKRSVRQSGEQSRFFYTATGRKIAARHTGSTGVSHTEIFSEAFLRFSDNLPRFRYADGAEFSTAEDLVFFLTDQVGNVLRVLGRHGADETREYLPFGETWFRSPASDNDRTFNGTLEEGGFQDYRARHYYAALGKFLQADGLVPDPAKPTSFNRYAYTENSPVIHRDDTGHFAFIPILLAAVANVLIHQDQIENFGDFLGVFTAGAIMGAVPGMTTTLGAGVLGSAAIGAAANMMSSAILYSVYGAEFSDQALFSSLVTGAVLGGLGTAFNNGMAGQELGKFEYAMARGTQGALMRGAGIAIRSAFGYEVPNGLEGTFAGAFASSFTQAIVSTNEWGRMNGETQKAEVNPDFAGRSFLGNFLAGIVDAGINGTLQDGQMMSASFLNSAGMAINNQMLASAVVDKVNIDLRANEAWARSRDQIQQRWMAQARSQSATGTPAVSVQR